MWISLLFAIPHYTVGKCFTAHYALDSNDKELYIKVGALNFIVCWSMTAAVPEEVFALTREKANDGFSRSPPINVKELE